MNQANPSSSTSKTDVAADFAQVAESFNLLVNDHALYVFTTEMFKELGYEPSTYCLASYNKLCSVLSRPLQKKIGESCFPSS